MSQLEERLKSGQFVVTGEIGPPKGTNVAHGLEEAEHFLKGKVIAVNVTDNQTAVMRVGSLAMCRLLLERGIEPVFQMVCRDRNRIALQSDALSAAVLGIENILALTGDHVIMGDHREARPVHDLDSVGLLQALARLEAGSDMGVDMKGNPNKLDGNPKFFKGCCVTPCGKNPQAQIIKLEKKVEAGAQFVQTQAVYDPATFERFMAGVDRLKVPVLVGIVVLKSAGMAKYMNRSVPGVQVPDALIKQLADAPKEDLKKVSTQIAARLVREVKPMCQGAHLMTLGWDDLVPGIIEQAEMA
ncbi:MAG: methylenetetrahydrofolate reductase [Phycisphaerae bacterium]